MHIMAVDFKILYSVRFGGGTLQKLVRAQHGYGASSSKGPPASIHLDCGYNCPLSPSSLHWTDGLPRKLVPIFKLCWCLAGYLRNGGRWIFLACASLAHGCALACPAACLPAWGLAAASRVGTLGRLWSWLTFPQPGTAWHVTLCSPCSSGPKGLGGAGNGNPGAAFRTSARSAQASTEG